MNFQNLLTLIEADVYGHGTPHKFADFDYGVKPKLSQEEELKKYRYDAVRNKAIEHGRALGFSKLVEPKIMSLIFGKYKLYKDSPTWIYTWEQGLTNKKIIPESLRDCIEKFNKSSKIAGAELIIDHLRKVWKIDEDNADLGSVSYVIGTLNGQPFVLLQTTQGSVPTLYFERSRHSFYQYYIPVKLENGNYMQVKAYEPGYIQYTLDEKGTILHRLDGPAQLYLHNPNYKQYWIDGRHLTEDQWAIISKFEDSADKQSAADMLNTLD